MITLTSSKRYSIRENFVECLKIYLAIKPLQFLYKKRTERTLNKLKVLPQGTIGFDIYTLLTENNLSIIPIFENHDLKHIILDYDMTSTEEIKMQAYLFGNGNTSISCILFLCSGILFPEHWKIFYNEYLKGKNSVSINTISFNEVITEQTAVLKNNYNQKK